MTNDEVKADVDHALESARTSMAIAAGEAHRDRMGSADMCGVIAGLLVASTGRRARDRRQMIGSLPYAVCAAWAEYGVDAGAPSWSFSMAAIVLGYADAALPDFLSGAYRATWQAGVDIRVIAEDMVRR